MTTIARTGVIALFLSTLSFAGIFPPQEGDFNAEIPFHFVIEGKTLPAGNYVIRAEENGKVLICEDGIYCETVKAAARQGEAVRSRVVFRHDGVSYHLSQLVTPGGKQHRLPAIPDPIIMPSGDSDEATISVEARPLCLHDHAGTGLAPAWH